MRDPLRTVHFRPYLKGKGPTFTLRTYDTGRSDSLGKSMLAYTLSQREGRTKTVLFDGADFGCSPMHAIDSDKAVASLMGFLTLRPGDTDEEYFDDYTEAQLAFASQHAETLAVECIARFGED